MKNRVKKIIPYLLILIVLGGVFGMAEKVEAQTGTGTCEVSNRNGDIIRREKFETQQKCTDLELLEGFTKRWVPDNKDEVTGICTTNSVVTEKTKSVCEAGGGQWRPKASDAAADGTDVQNTNSPKTAFENEIGKNICGFGVTGLGGSDSSFYPGCFVQASYGLFYVIPSFLLWLSAYFFNVLIFITLSGKLFANSTFIPTAWGVVRDLSNIFFILILLFIAIKIILDLAGHDAKKMIVKVIVIALLINFSMFFTQVIIDTSNVLALVFYNKMEVNTVNADGKVREYQNTANGEKDVAGGMVNAFNPTSLLTPDFFAKLKTQEIGGVKASTEVSGGMLIGITIIAGVLMFFAAYCFFVAGISFVGRMIELFVLIIFSPFAFMSSTIPILSSVEYLGWDAWFKRLLKTAFMAPIFMFFMYFIFMLIQAKIFDQIISKSNASFIETILLIIIPALVILILLLKATEYAKKGSGALGEKLMTGAKLIGGLALGAATGGTSLMATQAIGAISSKVASSEGLKTAANNKERGFTGWAARKMLKTADYGSKASFDIRATGLGKKFVSGTGINLGSANEGGYQGRKEKQKKKLEEESKLYKTSMSGDEVKAWSKKKQDEYDSNLAIAKKNGISEEEFKKKNGERPKGYKSADELNHDRMKEFINNFGQNGLTASLARSLLKASGGMVDQNNYKDSKEYKNWAEEKKDAEKEAQTREGSGFDKERFERMFKEAHKEPTIDDINKGRTQKVVMKAGVAAALAGIGGIAGIAGIATAAKVTTAGAAAFGVTRKFKEATGVKGTGEAAQGSFATDIEKGHKKLQKIEDRLTENTVALENLTTIMEEGKNMEVKDDISGEITKLVEKNKNGKDEVNLKGVEKRIAQLTFTMKREDLKLQELVKQNVPDNDPRMTAIKNAAFKATTELGQLNRLKTAPDQMRRLEKEKYDLGKDKDVFHKEEHDKEGGHKKEGKGGGGHATPKASAEPKHEHPPEAPSGGGHDAGHDAGHGGH
ncbi:MAG: hypothetical protein WA060_01205 [Minisyncoccia bacterium]